MIGSRCAVVIFEDGLNNILLYLRDDKSNISFPNTWGLFGGLLRENETPGHGIRREVNEELGLRNETIFEMRECKFLFTYSRMDMDRTEYVFGAPFTERVDQLILHEGQRLELFSQTRIENTNDIVPHHKKILLHYFGLKTKKNTLNI